MDTTTPIVPLPAQPSEPAEPAKSEEQKIAHGAGPAVSAPKPVEILSVPQTPLNNATPAGGTPRPELKIDEEPKEAPKQEEPFILEQVQEPLATVSSTAPKDDEPMLDKPVEEATNGASNAASTAGESTSSAAGDKRKLDEHVEGATNGDSKLEGSEPADKKAKVEEVKDAQANEVDAPPTTNGKVGRPRKGSQAEKKDKAVAAGKTARKTRSQGPAEAET